MVLVIVGRVRFPVHRHRCQLALPPGGIQHEDGEVVHLGGGPARAGGDGRVGIAAVELLQVPGRRLVMARPGLVAEADLVELRLGWPGGPQELQLLLQDLIFAAPHLMQVDLVNHAPARAVRGLGRFLPRFTNAR